MSEQNHALSRDSLMRYFGTGLTPLSLVDWLESIDREIEADRRGYLSACHNLHSLCLLKKDVTVSQFYARCNDCYIDGMALRAILLAAGIPTSSEQRFSLMDTFPRLLEHARRQSWTVFYLGSSVAVVDKARERIRREYPGLRMELRHGYFDDESLVVEAINAVRPQLLLVGMGMPRQEAWLLKNIDRLDVVVATQAGATLDYFVGAQAKPPLWLSRVGLAWLYRLLHDPLRLWRRYLVEPWVLLGPTLRLWLYR